MNPYVIMNGATLSHPVLDCICHVPFAGTTCRALLVLSFSEPVWSSYHLHSCPVPHPLLRIATDVGPQRVMGENEKWQWKDARESFIRLVEMKRGLKLSEMVYPSLREYAWAEAVVAAALLEHFELEPPATHRRYSPVAMNTLIKGGEHSDVLFWGFLLTGLYLWT